jgi:hypothetical protein
MGKVIEGILQVFGKKEKPDGTEEVLLDFLSKPGTVHRCRRSGFPERPAHLSGQASLSQILAQALVERVAHLSLGRARYSISASNSGSTHMPLCAIRLA